MLATPADFKTLVTRAGIDSFAAIHEQMQQQTSPVTESVHPFRLTPCIEACERRSVIFECEQAVAWCCLRNIHARFKHTNAAILLRVLEQTSSIIAKAIGDQPDEQLERLCYVFTPGHPVGPVAVVTCGDMEKVVVNPRSDDFIVRGHEGIGTL